LIVLFNSIFTQLFTFLSSNTKTKISNDIHLKELLTGSSISFSFRILGIVAGYIFTLLVTRNLGAKAIGIYALSLTLLSVFSIIGRLGVDNALVRFIAEYSSQNRHDLVKEVYMKALKIVIPFSTFLSVIFFFISPYIANYIFHKEYLSIYFQIISFSLLPLVLVFINSESLRGYKKIKECSFINLSISLFAIITLILLLFFIQEKYIPIISYIASIFIVSIISIFIWLKNIKTDLNSYNKNIKSNRDSLLNVALPMLLTSSLFLIMGWVDTIMLGIFRTEEEVGIYNVALRIATLTGITLFAINSIAAPKFAEFYGKGDIKGLGKVAQQSTKLIFWTSFPILLVLLLFPSFMLGIFGEEFKLGIYALLLLTLGQFVNAISGSVSILLNMTNRQNIVQYVIFTAAFINIVLNYILIPQYGFNGAAFASLFSMTFWNLMLVYYIYKEFKFITLYIPKLR
jgi:O-antigen/teichoic acid export membrane protein